MSFGVVGGPACPGHTFAAVFVDGGITYRRIGEKSFHTDHVRP